MTRTENLQAMMQLNATANLANTPEEALRIHQAYYVHQVIEAILTGNVGSLPTAKGVA